MNQLESRKFINAMMVKMVQSKSRRVRANLKALITKAEDQHSKEFKCPRIKYHWEK